MPPKKITALSCSRQGARLAANVQSDIDWISTYVRPDGKFRTHRPRRYRLHWPYPAGLDRHLAEADINVLEVTVPHHHTT